MGKLAIRRVVYNGKRYSFESPYLNDGIVIMEGVNGHGKSTFMSLIYYGLGGKVPSFNRNDTAAKSRHPEIWNDEDNYVELLIEINDEKFELTRYIGNNQIFIVDENTNVLETYIYRNNSDEDTDIFSDWILEKLSIEVFDIIQGTKNFKLNFSDLMRLIYHDQTTEVDKIYKEADNSNFITDSLEIRMAIFEVLLGKSYNEYYSAQGKYKLKLKEFEKTQAVMDSYDEFLGEILNEELSNVKHIEGVIQETQEILERIGIEREIAINEKNNSSEILTRIEDQRKVLMQCQREKDVLSQSKVAISQSMDKVVFLIDESEKELSEIEKIRFVNKKLKLFTPNTCPYCLRDVEREVGRCICGNEIDEME